MAFIGSFKAKMTGSHYISSPVQVVYAPQPRDRFTTPTFMQHNRFRRFQPTYPYLQHEIDLPPTISLSDGEEPPPYQGPCTLQLRDPEQQLELNRESVRAPPNRTIFDSDLIDMHSSGGGGGPRPPSNNSGISAASSSTHGRMEGPPPAYSQVIGQQPGIVLYLHQHSNNPSIPVTVQTPPRGRTDLNSPESTIALNKDWQREELVWGDGPSTRLGNREHSPPTKGMGSPSWHSRAQQRLMRLCDKSENMWMFCLVFFFIIRSWAYKRNHYIYFLSVQLR